MVIVIAHNIFSLCLNLAPTVTVALYQDYPNTACSLLSMGPYYIPTLVLIAILLGYKAFMTFRPLYFLNMNHEQMFKITMVFYFAIVVAEFSMILYLHGSFCQRLRIDTIYMVTNLEFDKSEFRFIPSLILPIHGFIPIIPECVYRIIEWRKKIKTRYVLIKPRNTFDKKRKKGSRYNIAVPQYFQEILKDFKWLKF